MNGWITRGFAVWVLLGAAWGWLVPGSVGWVLEGVEPMLGMVMFAMGLTLKAGDFRRALGRPLVVAGGMLAQFTVMPLVAWLLTAALGLPEVVAVGVVLVGCCPGGTASNVVTYLARGDVALSVTLTSVSTVMAPLVTPWLVWALAGQWVDVDPMALLSSILRIVLVPVLAGVAARHLFPQPVARVSRATPFASMLIIVLIVAGIVGRAAPTLGQVGPRLLAAVVLHNASGLALGHLAGGGLGLRPSGRRAVAFEVGMQNSGLAVALAVAHFAPAAALAGAVFSVWHNLTGPALASWWSRPPRGPRGAVLAGRRRFAPWRRVD